MDSIREIFLANEQIYNHNGFHGQDDSGVDERKMLQINNRLSRMGMYFVKLLHENVFYKLSS